MSGATLSKGWSIKRLDELARVTSGKRLPKGRRLSTAQTDHPYIRVTDMFMGGVDSSGIQYVPDDVFPEIAQFTVASGDIFISCAGTLGLVGIVPDSLHGANLTENANRIWSIQCDRRFLLSVLMSDRIQSVIQNIQTVGAQPKLALGRIRSFEIPCPDNLPEQQAIAAALSDADGVVAGLERVIAKKRLIKQGATQDLLTARRRLPGFSGEWEPVNLARESHLKARIGWQGLTTNEYRDSGEYHLITGTEIIDGRVDWRRCVFVDKWRFDQDRNIQLRNGDILLTKDGTIGKVAQVRDLPGPAALNSGVFVIRPKSAAYDATFLFHVLRSSVFDTFLAKLTAGSTIIHLYQKDLVTFEFLAPDIAEQKAIAETLDDMDAEIQTLESRLTKARAVKEGMMQNLLTGRVRLV